MSRFKVLQVSQKLLRALVKGMAVIDGAARAEGLAAVSHGGAWRVGEEMALGEQAWAPGPRGC